MNVITTDTCNDPDILRESAMALQRIVRTSANDWPAAYHHTLCYTKIADIVLKKDTIAAKSNYFLAKESFKRTDTLEPKQPENKTLALYLKIIELRFNKEKTRAIKIKQLESDIMTLQKDAPSNPRVLSMYAYYYLIFYNTDKTKKIKAIEFLKEACKHYDNQKAIGYYPSWGKKWNDELLLKVNIKSCENKSDKK